MTIEEFALKLDRLSNDMIDDVSHIVSETATEYFKGSFRRKAFDGAGWKRIFSGTFTTAVSVRLPHDVCTSISLQ